MVETDPQLVENSLEVVDSRLKFSSSDFLKQKLEDLKALSDNQLIDELDNIYGSEVFALRPVVNESNIEYVSQRYQNSTNHRISEEEEELSEFIADDYFAALLNDEGIIQVKDSI